MRSFWTRGVCVAVVGLLSLVLVADASAFGHHRRRGCGGCGGGCGGGYMGGPGYYGKGGYGYGGYGGGYGYGAPYAGYAPMPAYYGGTYGGAYGGQVYGTAPAAAVAPIDARQTVPAGTANADNGPIDRSARANTLVPAQGGANADLSAPSNSDIQPNAGIQGNANAAGTGGADASLRAAPPVAP